MQTSELEREDTDKLRDRVRAGKCILDLEVKKGGIPTGEKRPCGCRMASRGLCHRHRQLYYVLLRKLPTTAKRLAFEQEQIRLGRILPKGQQTRWLSDNPFTSELE